MNLQSISIAAALVASANGHLHAAEPVMAWSRTYDSGSNNNVSAVYQRATGVDGAGNVIVLGRTDSEWAVVKYLPDGSSSWMSRFRGSATGSAAGYDLAVDAAGNAHVTGYYSDTAAFSGSRLVTVKYLPDGTAAWTNYFTGIGYGVALDELGNVYVAGSTGAYGTGTDFVTLKYQPDGTAVWTNRYNGPGLPSNDSDGAITLVADHAGNVIVTGTSQGPGPGSAYATIKYRSEGTAVWTNRFSGPEISFDSASDLAVDGWGNVYVTGASKGSVGEWDYLTIKYYSDGMPAWTNRFNSLGNGRDWAASVKVDNEGGIYVGGRSIGKNYAVIKYNPAGAALWTNVFEGYYSTEGTSLAVDGAGNVFMAAGIVRNGTGPDIAVIQYLSNGTAVKTNWFIGQGDAIDTATALAVDQLGNVFVAATSNLGFSPTQSLMVRYPADGTPGWTNFFGIPVPGNDQVTKAVADASGNIYVVGVTWGFGTRSDYVTIKFQADGTPVWTNRYDGGRNNLDEVRDVAVDSVGNVYVTGNSRDNPSNRDDPGYLTIKYLSDGTPAWTNRFNPTPTVDHVSGIVVDQGGNAFVTGSTGHGDTTTTIKYRPDGTTEWVRSYRGSPGGTYPYATDMDSGGNIYVAGSDQTNGWFVIKYRPDGVALWTRLFNAGRGASASAIALDNADNLYVAGVSSSGPYGYNDYIVIKYKPDGTALWTNRYDGPANNNDSLNGTAVDKFGSVYVTGLSGIMFTSSAGADYATIKYLADGTPAWTNRFDGAGNGFDAGTAVGVDDLGNVFVTGNSTGAGTGIDHATIKYRFDGSAAWTNRLTGPAPLGSDTVWNVLPVASGDVIVVGTIINEDGSGDWILYRLAEPPDSNQVNLTLLPDLRVRLRFSGIPGQAYQVQRAPSANGPWSILATLTAPAHGMIEHIDSNPSPEGAFYRTALP